MSPTAEAILKQCRADWLKAGTVLFRARDELELPDDEASYALLALELTRLVEGGRVEAAGDPAIWRRSEVRLAGVSNGPASQQPTLFTAADDYAGFMSALMGLEDDATTSGYSQAGRDLLRQAVRVFGAEFDERHPGHG